MIPRISSSRMIRNSSPSILISEPLYLPNRTRSPFFYVEWLSGAIVFVLALSGSNNLALLGFLLRGVGNDNPPTNLLALFNPAHDHAIMKRCDVCSHMPTAPFNFP